MRIVGSVGLSSVVVDTGPCVLLCVDRQVSILVVVYVVMQHIIVASLFFEKFSIHVRVLFVRVSPDEVSATLIF